MGCAEPIALEPDSLPRLSGSATAALINNEQRLHLQHGPIDLIIDVDAAANDKRRVFSAAVMAFEGLLESLVTDLPQLRQINPVPVPVSSHCAQRMLDASQSFTGYGLTPMSAVAGAVADHIMASLIRVAPDKRIMINNGGDIAVHLGSAHSCTVGIVPDVSRPSVSASLRLTPALGVGGIATSGWRGRSHSLGIADSVTVLASCAAEADALATLIANHVDSRNENHHIKRQRACELDADSDLGEQWVTVAVEALSQHSIDDALDNAERFITALPADKKPISVFIALQGSYRVVGDVGPWPDKIMAVENN